MSVLEEPVPKEETLANVSAKSQGKSVIDEWTQQSTNTSVHWATVDPHLLIEEAYHGNGGFLGLAEGRGYDNVKAKTYIQAKPTENWFGNRVAGSVYNNIFKPYCKELIKPIYSAGVHYTTDNEALQDWLSSANGNGTSYDNLKKRIGYSSVAHQCAYAIMDRNTETGRISFSWKRVNDVYQDDEDMGYGVSSDNSLEWIGFLVGCDNDGVLTRHKHEVGKVVVQTKKPDINAKWEDKEEYLTGIDMLNVYPMFYEDTKAGEYVPEWPENINIVFLLASLYNHDCKVDYVVVQQAHGTMVISTNGKINGVPDGQSSALVLPMTSDGHKGEAKFISLPSGTLTELIDSADKKLDKVKNLMGDKGVELKQTSQAESGISKAFEFMGRNSELLHGVDMFRGLDAWVFEIWQKLDGSNVSTDVEVEYASDFYPDTDLTIDELQIADTMLAQANAIEARKEVHKKLMVKVLKGASHERITEIMDEIDGSKFNDPLTGMQVRD